jgi:hypothetical protein
MMGRNGVLEVGMEQEKKRDLREKDRNLKRAAVFVEERASCCYTMSIERVRWIRYLYQGKSFPERKQRSDFYAVYVHVKTFLRGRFRFPSSVRRDVVSVKERLNVTPMSFLSTLTLTSYRYTSFS